MAKLNCAKDGHYYILAGQSKGTWQVSDKGLRVLERRGIRLPRPGDNGVEVTQWWRYLWDNKLLFKYDIPYDTHHMADGRANEDSLARLPLLLNLDRQSDLISSWSLAIELKGIPEKIQAEAQECQALYLRANDALARSVYLNTIQPVSAVRVSPQSTPYEITWFDTSSRKLRLDTTCFSDGLNDMPLGNVFAEVADVNGYVGRRCLPGSSVAFWGTLYWLAADGYRPVWPGKAQRWGFSEDGWCLWRLTTSAEQPASWQAVADWLNVRSLTLTPHTQHLRLITPPLAITQDGWSLVNRDQPLVIGCTPPGRVTPGVRSQLQLTVSRVDGGHDVAVNGVPGLQQDVAPDEPWFARWTSPQPGDYRIHTLGNAIVQPLLVRVLSDASTYRVPPTWLQELTCRLAVNDHSETLMAFQAEYLHVTTFSAAELPHLVWSLQPPGLSVMVRWGPDIPQSDERSWHERIVESDEELTALWRDDVWPVCASARSARLTIEGESFGRIECVIGLPTCNEPEHGHVLAAAQRAELSWLAQLCLAPTAQPCIPLAADLRLALSRIQASESHVPSGATMRVAATLLSTRQAIPAWIAPRLRALVAAEPVQPRPSSVPAVPREATIDH